ncbi:MAG TPA: sugar ABC transporter ATP-binding protein, partial [Ruminococcus sp.]|nr:sugar ABC transporter ATP-binding protein [Ruminococcus sp.]
MERQANALAAIEIKNLTKSFRVYADQGHSLKEKALSARRRHYEKRMVLNDISLTVQKGEAIGLVGKNGCGKSTLLKLMSRILYPDSGSVKLEGRVSSLIELGAGFHPDMTGRENIFTNASIFGLTHKEIEEQLDEIIEFSEMQEFIDNPVRTYSSGMYMRLAFSVAIHVGADILLIDEILAVGDAAFQAKCFERLMEIKGSGTTIVIVSHSMAQLERICDRTVWIESGKVRMEGAPNEVHPMYLDFMGQRRQLSGGNQQLADREHSDSPAHWTD